MNKADAAKLANQLSTYFDMIKYPYKSVDVIQTQERFVPTIILEKAEHDYSHSFKETVIYVFGLTPEEEIDVKMK